jgi:hypothetical protein
VSNFVPNAQLAMDLFARQMVTRDGLPTQIKLVLVVIGTLIVQILSAVQFPTMISKRTSQDAFLKHQRMACVMNTVGRIISGRCRIGTFPT